MACAKAEKFLALRRARRVWAVGSIHGCANQLRELHERLSDRLIKGDKIVYLGNYIGAGAEIADTLDELLLFRRTLLALPGGFVCDVVFLRGSQEEIFAKLMQLHLAINPPEVLEWMLPRGLAATLKGYDQDIALLSSSARSGARYIARWLNDFRAFVQDRHPGHLELMSALRRAAYTSEGTLLFVHAGIDPERPLETQGDRLWWGNAGNWPPARPYSGYKRVIRGFDRAHPGLVVEDHSATVDGGAGFGGSLIAACFDQKGRLADQVTV